MQVKKALDDLEAFDPTAFVAAVEVAKPEWAGAARRHRADKLRTTNAEIGSKLGGVEEARKRLEAPSASSAPLDTQDYLDYLAISA